MRDKRNGETERDGKGENRKGTETIYNLLHRDNVSIAFLECFQDGMRITQVPLSEPGVLDGAAIFPMG